MVMGFNGVYWVGRIGCGVCRRIGFAVLWGLSLMVCVTSLGLSLYGVCHCM